MFFSASGQAEGKSSGKYNGLGPNLSEKCPFSGKLGKYAQGEPLCTREALRGAPSHYYLLYFLHLKHECVCQLEEASGLS